MAREGYLILDSDLHMMEPDDLWVRYLDEPYRSSNPPRFFGGQLQKLAESSEDKGNADVIEGMEVQGLAIPAHVKLPGAAASRFELRRRSRARHPHFNVARARAFDPASTLTAMDIEGIDVAVMYGTRGRQILCHDDLAPDYAAALARAYNNWAADYCKSDPRRLKFAAQIAMHDVPMAVAEARRCVIQLGAVAVIGTPNPVNGQHLHDEACEPLWDELERLDVPIGFHPTGTTALRDDAGRRYVGHANFHPIAHAIRNPVELMGARQPYRRWRPRTPSQIARRVPRRNGGVALLVAVAARRSVGEIRTRLRASAVDAAERVLQAPMLHRARCRRGAGGRCRQQGRPRIFRGVVGLSALRGAFPEAIQQFLSLPLSGEARRKILWDNCARLYAIETPAMPLTQEQKTVSAAE
jgi:uncharacterized protein